MNKLSLIKVGGKVVENPETLAKLLNDFKQISGYKILVHGGGKLATNLSQKMGIETQMVDGRRITDQATLEVVTMVYAGLVNKNSVAKLQALNKEITRQLKDEILVTPKVKLVPRNSLPKSEGKAVRVKDLRKKF